MADYENNLHELVGASIDKPELLDFLKGLDPSEKPSNFEGNIHWDSDEAGLALNVEGTTKRVVAVYLFAEGEEEHKQYTKALPKGIRFGMSRDEVNQLVAKTPAFSGKAHDTFECDSHRLVVQYDKAGNASRVTLMG